MNNDSFRAGLRNLSSLQSPGIDELLDDGHARLELYRSTLPAAELDRWLGVVLLDPDVAMATAVLVELVDAKADGLEADAFERWAAELLPSLSDRPFVRSRIAEWLVLDRLGTGDEATDQLLAASDWLQRKAADRVGSRRVLEQLVEKGRTKRVRRPAAIRLLETDRG